MAARVASVRVMQTRSMQSVVPDGEPSVLSSVGRAIEAGQRLIVDRVDLAKLDVLRALSNTFRGTALLLGGGLLLAIGWTALSAAATIVLHDRGLGWAASACATGVANVLVGALLAGIGVRAAQGEASPWTTTSNGETSS